MKNFYTAREAQERLGTDKNNFYYLIRKGTIKSVTLPGRKYSVYPKSEIDKFAAAIKTVLEQYDRETSTFRVATFEDLQEEFAMDVSLYGRNTAPVAIRTAKLERNPESDYVLVNEGEIVGHISFHPVESKALQLFLEGEIDTILPEMVLPFTPGTPHDILMVVMGVKPGFPPDVARHYGQRLIAGTITIARELGERGIEICNIHATSRTSTGIRMCRKLGMREEPIPNERGRYRYTLNVPTSDSLLVREYQEGFDEYKKRKAEEPINPLQSKVKPHRKPSESDSKPERKPRIMTHTNEQSGLQRASPSREDKAL